MAVRTVIFEDNQPLREALSFLIDATDGFDLLGSFGDCLSAEKQVSTLQPDVVLMDIDLPGRSGIDAVRSLRERYSHVDVLMLTVFDDDERVFEAIRAGATGYLLKKTPPVRLLEAIQEVYDGGAPMSPAIARRVMGALQIRPNPHLADLTPRESEVLALLAKGNSYKMVAAQLGITVETTRTHIKRIYEKLHVHSVTEALAKYHGK
ncbi:response regulator [Fibrella aquatica]|jgi:DNA-binding NarL/FixJ family response regulator|uniref:response regulator n=1 Tax=Fibrella aquatica TaxID=3242487 RepID=UPI003522649D